MRAMDCKGLVIAIEHGSDVDGTVAHGVAADRSKRGPVDRARINLGEDYEVRYWSEKFGCTHDELKAAVRKVGVMEKDVEAELRRSKGR